MSEEVDEIGLDPEGLIALCIKKCKAKKDSIKVEPEREEIDSDDIAAVVKRTTFEQME